MTPAEILKDQGMDYTVKGKDLIISCLNPEHEDNNPSMRVDSQTGIFHCFSCNAKGNLFTRFNKILNTLNLRQKSILDMINNLAPHKLTLPTDASIFDEEYRNISAETYINFGVFKSDDFEGRLVLPIYNFKKEIVAFMGRFQYSKLDPKYLVYPSGKSLPLFPPATEIHSDTLLIVEGMFDLLNLYDKGITNVITSFGLLQAKKRTNKYNNKVLDKLIPYKIGGVSKIFICYDGDKPGLTAAKRLVQALEDDFIVDHIELPEGLDPGDMDQEQVNDLKGLIGYEQERVEKVSEVSEETPRTWKY